MNSFFLHAAELTASDKETLAMIAQHLRANREVLNSFECEYVRSRENSTFGIQSMKERLKNRNPNIIIDMPEKKVHKGRFAFKDDKVLSFEDIADTNDYLHFIKNGKQLRTVSQHNLRIFVLGTEGNPDIRPPIPDPWDYTGHSLMYELDKIDTPYDKIASVKSVTENIKELIVVTIEQRLNTSPENQVDNLLTIQFSVQDGYLPVRVRQEIKTKSGKEPEYISDATISKILKYDFDDKSLYFPVSYNQKVYRNGKLSSTSYFNIKEETVKINPDLPDGMFWVDIQPGDIVVDKDKGIQYRASSADVVGAPAPDFTLGLLGSNEKVTLSKVKEDVIVLDFWATWCGPCKKIHPALEAVHKWAKDNNKSIAFYCINLKEQSELVSEYWEKSGSDIPVLLDTDGSVFTDYKGSGIPYVVIISGNIIRNVHIGSGAEVNVLQQHIKDIIIEAIRPSDAEN
jgi:thiol-disulfide isomerase/thioredoxin